MAQQCEQHSATSVSATSGNVQQSSTPLVCGLCKQTFEDKPLLRQHLLDDHDILTHNTKWRLNKLANKDVKILKLCYMNDITPDIPPFQIGKAPVRKALQNLPPPSEEEVNFLKSIESWKASEQTVRWFLARSLFKQNDLTESSEQKLEEAATSSILGEQTFTVHAPDSRPTLSLATEWFMKDGHTSTKMALVDTGSNTSLIVSNTVATLVDHFGNQFHTTKLAKPLSLLTASGSSITAKRSATLNFRIANVDITHCFYVIDSLPISEQIILGMDFLTRHGVCINFADNIITLSEDNHSANQQAVDVSLLTMEDITLPAHKTKCVLLAAQNALHGAAMDGYLAQHNKLPDGCMLWHGIQTLENGKAKVFLSNTTSYDINIKSATPIAVWEPDTHDEIHVADHIVTTARQCNELSATQPSASLFTLTATDDTEEWEWQDDHLYLDMSRTPVGTPDPPVDASIEQLSDAWIDTLQKLDTIKSSDSDSCDDRRTLLQQLERINSRIKQYGDENCLTPQELPSDLNLEIGYGHLSAEEKQRLKAVLTSEATFFMKGKYPRVIRTEQPVRIDVGKAAPRKSGFRRLNPEEQNVVNEYVEKLIAADVVEPGNGPWSSPIPLVPKKDGGLRAVADLRKVNECVLPDSYTMPDTQELIDQLSGAKWFTSLDLSSAFWQLPLAEESRDCTAFMTKTHGLLRWKALPMGFKNSSAYFQREIDAALKGLRISCCVVYIDDVCVYSSGSLQDHLDKVKAVLHALRVVGFSGNPLKCKFAQREVSFLGHRIADGKVFALDDKVKAMMEYKRPTSLRELRGFLGLMSYYRKFIKDFASIAAPLNELTKQSRLNKTARQLKIEANTTWEKDQWNAAHDEAFETLKGALLCRPVLVLPNKNHTWRLATDASNVAMGAVLSQINEKGEEHPIGYYSRKLTPAETKWSIWELELAAVVWATTVVCRNYLRGTHFELVTDSKVVVALIKKEVPKRRENLLVRLFEYDFTVTHRKGELNRNADFFSRWAAYKDWEEQNLLKVCCTKLFVSTEDVSQKDQTLMKRLVLDPLATTRLADENDHPDFSAVRRKIVEEQRKDPKLALIIAKLETADVVRMELEDESTQPDSIESADEPQQASVPSASVQEYSREEKVEAAVHDTNSAAVEQHEGKEEKNSTSVPEITKAQLRKYKLVGPDKILVQGCYYRTAKKEQSIMVWPIVVPDSMVPAIMGLFHGDKSPLGHGGKHKTYGAIRKRFVWKTMTKSIRQWIGACHKCLRRKRRPPVVQQYNVHPKAVAPMNRICIDFVGPLTRTTRGNTHILTVYDPFSHWPSAYAVDSTEAEVVIACLKKHIALHSVPAEVLSDQGKNLMAAAVKDFLADMGAKKFEVSAYHPQSNGSVERFHSYLGNALANAILEQQGEWDQHIDSILFAYRTTPIDGLDITPFEVIYGRNPNLPIDNLLFRENYSDPLETLSDYMDYLDDNQYNMFKAMYEARKDRFDRNKRAAGANHKVPVYAVGEKIYLDFPKGRFRPLGGSTKLSPLNDGPYTVLEKLCNGLVYKVQHDRKGFVHNAAVSRMMRVPTMVIPDNAVDLPHTGFWKQLDPDRVDRINDISAAQHQQRQQELLEANDEARARPRKRNNVAERKEIEPEFEIEEELVEAEDMEEEMNEDQQRKKRKPTKAQAVEHPEKKDEEMSAPEKKKKEQKPKEKKFRIPEEPIEFKPQYATTAKARAARAQLRAEQTGVSWIQATPIHSDNGHDQVTPVLGKEVQVRLDMPPPSWRNARVESTRRTSQQ